MKNWTKNDDLEVLNAIYSSYKSTDFNEIIRKVSKEINTSQASTKARVLNYVAILSDGKFGLTHVADNSRLAVKEFLGSKSISKNKLLMILK